MSWPSIVDKIITDVFSLGVAWRRVTSALIGASKVSQIDDAIGMLANTNFSDKEINAIEHILA